MGAEQLRQPAQPDQQPPRRRKAEVISGHEDAWKRFPDRYIAVHITEEAPVVGFAKGEIIAIGKRKKRVTQKVKEFMINHPKEQVGVFDTILMKGDFLIEVTDVAA